MFYTIQNFALVAEKLLLANKKIVLVTGFFDLMHSEHINFLNKARAEGDVLVVAVESDLRAQIIKGPDRPHDSQNVRCQNVSQYADYVIALGDDFDNPIAYESLLTNVRPSVYAVSSHSSHLENKQKMAQKHGSSLKIVHPWNPQVSTSRILESRKKQL